jgi:disulfide bond formation protein DsbB
MPYAFIYAAWVIALVGTLGSLVFSEIMGLAACTLCWYQRICLYPLVTILAAGILLRDRKLTYYALPLAVAGTAISLYHNLLYYKVIPEALAPCRQGVSCTTQQLNLLGFITIPLMALTAFVLVVTCLLLFQAKERKARA